MYKLKDLQEKKKKKKYIVKNPISKEEPIILNQKRKIVVSFTTIPSRYENLLLAVKAFRRQTIPVDEIYVTIPKYSKRLQQEYPPLPEEIKSLAKIVYIDEDYGPICKIYGALYEEQEPETIIISCDDDVNVGENFIENFVPQSDLFPDYAIARSGALIKYGSLLMGVYPAPISNHYSFNIPKEGRFIDIVYGTGIVLYKRKFFPVKENLFTELIKYTLEDRNVFINDDVLISGYLNSKKIKRLLRPDNIHIGASIGKNSLSGSDMMIYSIDKAVKYLEKYKMFEETEDMNITDIFIFNIILIIIIIIIILIIIYILYRYFK